MYDPMDPAEHLGPTTPDEAREAAGLFDQLHALGGWGKAAIAYGCTTNEGRGGDNRRTNGDASSFPLSVARFAALGVPGLSDRKTVAKYRRAWEWAIREGYTEHFAPGEPYALPSISWDEYQRAPKVHTADDGARTTDDDSTRQLLHPVREAFRALKEQYRTERDPERREALARCLWDEASRLMAALDVPNLDSAA